MDASGLDVNEDVDLVARDASGAVVNYVTIDPHNVHITMQVGSQTRSETVPVNPNVINSPAAGYSIASVTVTPPVIEVHGQADALALLKGAATTEPISVAGATSDVSVSVGLVLPTGVTRSPRSRSWFISRRGPRPAASASASCRRGLGPISITLSPR